MLGETPLACMERFRVAFPAYGAEAMTYAGRLDPMASGLLLCLSGETCKEKELYTNLPKTYVFEVLVGFHTDSYDLLGLVDEVGTTTLSDGGFRKALATCVGTFTQEYPPFSSKTVGGVPLHTLTRRGETDFDLPTRNVSIEKLELISSKQSLGEALCKEILHRTSLVVGDFRQKEIIERWRSVLQPHPENEYTIFECSVTCSSGTYVRGLVHRLKELTGIPLCTFAICRTEVGSYALPTAVIL